MSEHVTYKGKLKEVFAEVESLNEKITNLFESKKIILSDDEKEDLICSFYEYDFYDSHVLLEDKLYEIIEKDELMNDLFQMNANDNGELEFVVSYYNGGCGFSEAIEYAYKNKK